MADIEPIKILGESLGVWIQTGAVVLSAFYAGRQVLLLRVQTDKNEQQVRRRATVDMVLHEKQDTALREARIKFAELRDGKNNITQYACRPLSEHPDENAAIMAILNNYEFMATGIREGAFDERIYKRM
jgi:tRNA(Ile2) C34 agmatinyltransferase TiaS